LETAHALPLLWRFVLGNRRSSCDSHYTCREWGSFDGRRGRLPAGNDNFCWMRVHCISQCCDVEDRVAIDLKEDDKSTIFIYINSVASRGHNQHLIRRASDESVCNSRTRSSHNFDYEHISYNIFFGWYYFSGFRGRNLDKRYVLRHPNSGREIVVACGVADSVRSCIDFRRTGHLGASFKKCDMGYHPAWPDLDSQTGFRFAEWRKC